MQLNNFLSGNGLNVTVGYWGGVSESWSPGNGSATGVGFVTPQFGGSYNYSFQGSGNTGLGSAGVKVVVASVEIMLP